MDTFPPDFNRASCMGIISKNQFTLRKQVREQFYNTITEAATSCQTSVQLIYPDNLWSQHKIQLTQELLEKFDRLEVQSVTRLSNHRQSAAVTKILYQDEPIPPEVISITVYFKE